MKLRKRQPLRASEGGPAAATVHPRTPIICRGLLVSFNQLKPKSLCQLPLRQRTKWKSRRVKNRTLRYMSWPGTQSHRNRHRWLIAEKLQDRQDRRSPTAGWGGRHGSISVAASVAQRSRFKPCGSSTSFVFSFALAVERIPCAIGPLPRPDAHGMETTGNGAG